MIRKFIIERPNEAIKGSIIDKIDNLTKPKGSLGVLEDIALQIGLIQQTLSPKLTNPNNVIFAADHGIVEEGVSVSPKEVTWQQVANFLKGGGGVNFFCRQHNFKLKVVDAGVDFDFPKDCGVIDKKVGKGTRNFLKEGAMTIEELEMCVQHGSDVVTDCYKEGCNIISFGEMGIGNTSPSSVWMSMFTGIPLQQCVGAGSGLSSAGVSKKYDVLKRAIDNYIVSQSSEKCLEENSKVIDIIRYFGGYEMVMTIGAMLRAAELKMVILIDGFIMTNCILAAKQLYPAVIEYAIFSHSGDECGHKLLLDNMGVHPLLSLRLRLGEGTGAICSYPIVDSAIRMINEMKTFENASITKYF